MTREKRSNSVSYSFSVLFVKNTCTALQRTLFHVVVCVVDLEAREKKADAQKTEEVKITRTLEEEVRSVTSVLDEEMSSNLSLSYIINKNINKQINRLDIVLPSEKIIKN